MLSPLTSGHYEKIVTMHQNVCLQAFMEEVARRSHASGKSSRLQNLSMVFSPTLGQHPKNRTSSFANSHTRQAALPGVLVWQSDVDVANCVCVEVGSTLVSGGNQQRVLNSKHVFQTRNTEKDSQSFQRRCRREDRFDPFVAYLRTHQTRTVSCCFGATCVGTEPLEDNWVASCSCPCFRFSGVLVHLHVPQILHFLLTNTFDLIWVQMVRP